MTLKEIAEKIDKSEDNADWISFSQIADELNINYYIATPADFRIKAYWIARWYCTDSWVGYRMYFFDDTPVAFSTQEGRKCDEKFKWFGRTEFELVRNYMESLISMEDADYINYVSINEDIGDSYKISFNTQVLDWSKARYNNVPFKHIERIPNKPYNIDTENKIQLPDGSEKIVDIKDVDFIFNLA